MKTVKRAEVTLKLETNREIDRQQSPRCEEGVHHDPHSHIQVYEDGKVKSLEEKIKEETTRE